MNIFIMILVTLFMAGFLMIDSPNQQIEKHTTEYAVNQSDLKTIAQCATAVHNAQINGTQFNDVCIEQFGIESQFICMDAKHKKTNCEIVRNKKPAFSFIVTSTAQLNPEQYNQVMEVLEKHFAESGTFGLFQEEKIMAGGTATKRSVPKTIVEEMELQDGQLVYMTQYEIPDAGTQFATSATADIICPIGYAKAYRFGRWQCVPYNAQTNCAGDMIWDSDLYECVPDESRKPLCAEKQTAVMVESVWECIDPFPEKSCPDKMTARLNYNTLEWECVMDPGSITNTKKCDNVKNGAVYGPLGTTLRVPQSSCTDCEVMVTDYETCKTFCIPDASKINNPSCYPGAAGECSGESRAFYFGFPSKTYIKNVEAVAGTTVPLDKKHSQNRKFNCLDCGDGVIDTEKSKPPYVAICK